MSNKSYLCRRCVREGCLICSSCKHFGNPSSIGDYFMEKPRRGKPMIITTDSAFDEDVTKYMINDVEMTREAYKIMVNGLYGSKKVERPYAGPYKIQKVIFNDPATIVFWPDGSKTVVKCQEGDVFDPEKGLAMAIVKKVYGNKGSYCNEIKKWTEKYEAESPYPLIDASRFLNVEEMHKQLTEFTNKLIKIRKERGEN